MGYTTKFNGKFTLSKLPKAETIVSLMQLSGSEGDDIVGAPDSYCQWQLTKDCLHLEWGGGEKFYNYSEWLQFIADKFFTPEGIEVTGEVLFDGEEIGDTGTLQVVSGKVVSKKLQIIPDDIDELIRFRNFVLKLDCADDIVRAWKKENR